jgi:hypothetical protein
MSNWTSISSADVYDYLAAEQAAALQSEALGTGQSDPLPRLIADVVSRVRAEVRAHGSNVVDAATGTVPPELRGAAMALIVEAAQARLPSLDMTADQIRLANAARALLKRVADGDVAVAAGSVTTTTTPETTDASAVKFVLVKSRNNPVTGASLAGL